MRGLGWLPGDNFSEALAVNAKGSVIVGVSGVEGSSNDYQAFLWTKQTGMISIQSLLERDGLDLQWRESPACDRYFC